MKNLRVILKHIVRAILRPVGIDLIRYQSRTSSLTLTDTSNKSVHADLSRDLIAVPRYLCPSAHKLYDFRMEDGFATIAAETINQGRTLLEYNRLFVLWQAIRNVHTLNGAVAEVGTYRGGSARFIAAAFNYWQCHPTFHVFDTFQGHPSTSIGPLDGPHTTELFADTNVGDVRKYLAPFSNIEVHEGEFREMCHTVVNMTFSMVHIDVDLYQSTIDCLQFFWPRLCVDGVIVIDDYGFITCQGLKLAVDAFAQQTADCRVWYVHTGQLVIHKGRSI